MGIASEYAWFLISSIVCFICYGTITWRWVREVRAQAFGAGRDVDRERIREGVVTIWYPIGECACGIEPRLDPQINTLVINTYIAIAICSIFCRDFPSIRAPTRRRAVSLYA